MIGCLFFSCSISDKDQQQDFKIENSKENILIKNISIDSISLKISNTSYVGFLHFQDNQIYFFDEILATLFLFDKSGKSQDTYLGKGESPKEVKNLQNYLKINQKNYIFYGWDIYVYNQDWVRQQSMRIDWQVEQSLKELESNPKPSYKGIYEIKYFNNRFLKLNNDYLLTNIESSHPLFNGYFQNTAYSYFKSAFLFAKINLHSGKVERLVGKYPPIYVENPNIPIFANWYADTDMENLFVSFEADSLIYVFDKQLRLQRAFGRKGLDMNQNYRKTENYDEYQQFFRSERNTKGYYSNIKYFKENDILLRVYSQGTSTANGKLDQDVAIFQRMQIYKGTTLIGDVAVPPRFRVLAYENGYYYADGVVDELNERLYLYKFKISKPSSK